MASAMPRLTIVVARARNGAIGRNNAMAWHLPEDLQHFKATTIGHPMIMGRLTFDSIGRPLPGRRTIVVTRNPQWSHEGCERAGSLDEAIALCQGASEVFIVGGAQLYSQALPLADRIILTEVDIEVDGDAFFPALDTMNWTRISTAPAVSRTGLHYAIDLWEPARGTR